MSATRLAPLYRDAARVIHSVHPSAILFLEGHLSTNCGLRNALASAGFRAGRLCSPLLPSDHRGVGPMAWHDTGDESGVRQYDRDRTGPGTRRCSWESSASVPRSVRAGDYVGAIYDRLDACLASGAQWNYTPRWNAQTKDGWNAEDFNILDPPGTLRSNFRPDLIRAQPRASPCDFVTRRRGLPVVRVGSSSTGITTPIAA